MDVKSLKLRLIQLASTCDDSQILSDCIQLLNKQELTMLKEQSILIPPAKGMEPDHDLLDLQDSINDVFR